MKIEPSAARDHIQPRWLVSHEHIITFNRIINGMHISYWPIPEVEPLSRETTWFVTHQLKTNNLSSYENRKRCHNLNQTRGMVKNHRHYSYSSLWIFAYAIEIYL